ncbi:MAG: hypothetical protein DRJ52_11390 [Thermoprotei archaeon]|nr:MAG: hypothetical protein DRJ52_11390 [Thermoprotei archaeon]
MRVEFWYQLPVTASVDYIMKCALKAEKIGFDGVTHEDHFLVVRVGSGCRPECWTMLTAVAMKTNLKVAPLVVCIPYRPPTLLAKIVTTLDQLTKGRVMLIYGAGWWREEFESFGYKWEPDKIRVERTFEAIKLIKRLWTEENVTFEGKYYSVKNCTLEPKPYQKPHPPILCGGQGKRMRKFAAQNVDGWVGAVKLGGFKEYLERKRFVEKYCRKKDFIYGYAVRFNGYEVSPEDLIEEFKQYIKIGVTWINIRVDPDTENLELLDKIAEVIKYFKKQLT